MVIETKFLPVIWGGALPYSLRWISTVAFFVRVTRVNKKEAMYGRSLVNV